MRHLRFSFLLFLVLSSADRVMGQTPGDPSRLTAAPASIYDVADFGKVDLSNGNLELHIPLLRLPGRGIDTDILMSYNSKLWMSGQSQPDPSFPPQVNTATDPSVPTSPVFGWSVGQRRLGRPVGWNQITCLDDPSTCNLFESYQEWLAPEGVRMALSSGQGCCFTPPSTGFYYSFDGSFAMGETLQKIMFKDGISATNSTLEDTNGNQITSGSNSSTQGYIKDTLGRMIYFNYSSSGVLESITYLDSTGANRSINFSYTTQTLNMPYISTSCYQTVQQSSNVALLNTVTLANGRTFQFQYVMNSDGTTTGEIAKVILPTGGYIRYNYGFGDISNDTSLTCFFNTTYSNAMGQNRMVTARIVSSDGTTASEKTWTYGSTFSGGNQVMTVTDPVGNKQVTTLTQGWGVTKEEDYQDPSGTTIKTVKFNNQCNNSADHPYLPYGLENVCADPKVLSRITILSDVNQQSESAYSYGNYSNVTEQDDYDWGAGSPGPLVRKSTYAYLNDSNSAYSADAVHILNRKTSGIVYDAGGCARRQTTISYDGAATSSTSSIVQHDYSGFSSSFNLRGNPTQVAQWLGQGTTTGTCNTGGSWLTTTNSYSDVGDVLQTTDPNGNTTSFSYADNFYSYTPPNPTGAFITQKTLPTTNGHSHIERFQYYFNSGLVAAKCGQNFAGANCAVGLSAPQSDYSTFTYDPMNRRLIAAFGDGGQNSISYNETSLPITISSATKIRSSSSVTSVTQYDGLGRATQNQLTSDPDGTTYTVKTYDALGRQSQIYNPTRCSPPTSNCGESTWGYTTYTYDPLSRITQVANPDNSTVMTAYKGRATQVQDEGNGAQRVTRISQIDGLGRLTSVCEVSGSTLIGSGGTPAPCGLDIGGTGFLTTYQYDVLGNLTQVSQSGLNGRTFAYDSLSRLVTSTNPESSTTTYTYDNDGNLHTKADARGITITYSFDPLNRLTGKTYSDSTPAATFSYDQTSAMGVSLTNTIGRKSSETTAGSNPTGAVFSYDPMGRVADNSQCTPQNCGSGTFPFQYTQYDLIGDLVSATNGMGVTNTYSYSSAGRLTGMSTNFVDGSHPGTLFSNAHYAPFGHLSTSSLGNGIAESFAYDDRLREQSYSAMSGSTTRYSFNVSSFASDGNILSVNDSVNGTWSYSYDEMNRLCSANQSSTEPVCHQSAFYTYDYDRFSNRWHQNGPNSSQLAFDANNHITGVTGVAYDASGNLTSDGTHSYTYDAESRITAVDGGSTAAYVYDAEGRRVRKTTASRGSVDYLYDLDGNQVEEVAAGGIPNRGELYIGKRHLLTYTAGPNGTTYFIHSDWLGTERARTDLTTNPCEKITSLPFGDGQTVVSSCPEGDVSPMHFAGKQYDAESGLDDFDARYYSPTTGRFISADWSAVPVPVPYANLTNPQTLNLYAIVSDNPVTFADLDGHQVLPAGEMRDDISEYISLIRTVEDRRSDYYLPVCICGGQQAAQNQQTQQNAAPANSRTDVVLYPRELPPTPQPGTSFFWEMDWKIGTCSGGSCTQSSTNQNQTVSLVEQVGKGEWKPTGDPSKGEAHDQISPEPKSFNQHWFVADPGGKPKQVQLVVGKDSKGNLIKTWEVHVEIKKTGDRPVYSPVP